MDDLHQATGRDLNLVVAQKDNATVGGDMQEKIQGLRQSVAGISPQLQAPKNWIGSSGVNLFQVVCDMLDLLRQMNTQLAAHTHVPGPMPSPTDAAAFTAKAAQALALALLVTQQPFCLSCKSHPLSSDLIAFSQLTREFL